MVSALGGHSMAARRVHAPLPDSLSVAYRHTDAIKRLTIYRDTTTARQLWQGIIEEDSTYSPALFHLSLLENSAEAVDYARRAFVADTTNKWYADNYANKLVVSAQYTRAIPIYRRLLNLDPKNLMAYHALAVIYNASGMPYSAISILDSAELRNGYNHYLAEIKHGLLLDTRQYERATEEGRRRVLEMPYDISARRALAETYAEAGRDSLAEVTFLEAFRLDTTNVETIDLIANFYYRRRDVERMFDFEDRLFRSKDIDIEEKLHKVRQYRANTAFYIDNYIRIGSIIQRLAIDYPDNRDVVDIYARHLIACGEYEQALSLLRSNLAHKDTKPMDYMSLIQYEYTLERMDIMEEDLKAGLERFPEDISLLSFHGFIRMEMGDEKGAIAIFKRGLSIATTDEQKSELWGSIGDVYHQMGNDKATFKAYKKALAYNAENVLVLNNYAYYLSLEDRELERALEMSQRAMTAAPNNDSYVDTYAWILHRLGRNDEAKRYMRQALTLSGQRDASLLCHYADILWALGEKFMAETYWKKAVEMGYDEEEMATHIATLKAATTNKE